MRCKLPDEKARERDAHGPFSFLASCPGYFFIFRVMYRAVHTTTVAHDVVPGAWNSAGVVLDE